MNCMSNRDRKNLISAMKRVGAYSNKLDSLSGTSSSDQLVEDLRLILFELHCLVEVKREEL